MEDQVTNQGGTKPAIRLIPKKPRLELINRNGITTKERVCAYCRVSTGKPEQMASLEMQKRYWYEYLMHDDRLEFVDVFTDIGKSGKSIKGREQLNTLVEMALNGEIDIIFTKSISRFSRNLEDTLNIIYELREKGVEIYFDDEDLSTMNPHCSLTLNVLAKNDADHLNVISESMKWAARKRFERGEVELNSTILGYFYKDKKLHIIPEQAEIVKDIFNMYLKGLGVTKIAIECERKGYKTATGLQSWKKSTISKILKNEKYTGDSLLQKTYKENFKKVCNNGELNMYYCENTHEAIIQKADETTVQVLREPGRKAVSQSYMWLYRTSGDTAKPIVLYDYQQTRSSSHPKRFLSEWKGYLHTDGYSGYHSLPEITPVGCWAHMRRKFDEALQGMTPQEREKSEAQIGLEYCNRLFAWEKVFEKLFPEERFKQRKEQSQPVAEAFFAWVRGLNALPKSLLGKAVHYACEQQKYLMNVYILTAGWNCPITVPSGALSRL